MSVEQLIDARRVSNSICRHMVTGADPFRGMLTHSRRTAARVSKLHGGYRLPQSLLGGSSAKWPPTSKLFSGCAAGGVVFDSPSRPLRLAEIRARLCFLALPVSCLSG